MRLAKIQAVVVADTQQFDDALKRSEQTAAVFAESSKKSFDKLDKQLALVGKSADLSAGEITALSSKLKQSTALDSAANSLNRVANAAKMSDAEIRKLASGMGLGTAPKLSSRFDADNQSALTLKSTLSQLKGVVAGYVGVGILRDIAGTSVDLASMQKTFYAITGSSAGAREEMAYLRTEAQRLGLDFMTLADSFKGFSAAGKSAGMDAAQVRSIFTAVTEASTVLGLNSQKTGLALYALEQMLSKGAVSMEELRRQLGDQLPGAFQIAAKSMGMTTQEFAKLVESGKLSSAEFLPKFAQGLRDAFGHGLAEAVKTPRAEIQRLMNELTFAKAEIGEGGFLRGIAGAAKDLTASFRTEEMQSSLRQLGNSLGEITGMIGKLGALGVSNSTGLLSLASGFTASAVAGRTLAPVITAVSESLAEVKKIGAGKALLGLFGGPIGIATTAIGALAAGVTYLSLQQNDGEKIAAKYSDRLDAIAIGGDVAAASLTNLIEKTSRLNAEQTKLELSSAMRDLETQKKVLQEQSSISPLNLFHSEEDIVALIDYSDVLKKLGDGALTTEEALSKLAKAANQANTAYSKDQYEKAVKMVETYRAAGEHVGVLTGHLGELIAGITPVSAVMEQSAKNADNFSERINTLAAASANLGKASDWVKEYANAQDMLKRIELGDAEFYRQKAVAKYNAIISGLEAQQQAANAEIKIIAEALEVKKQLTAEEMSLLAMRTAGAVMAFSEAQSVLEGFKANRDKILSQIQGTSVSKGGVGGPKQKSGPSKDEIARTVRDAQKEYKNAEKSLTDFRDKYIELQATLSGSGLDVSFTKIARETQNSIQDIERRIQDLIEKEREWKKEGKLTESASAHIAQARQTLEEEKNLAMAMQATNIVIAARADLQKSFKAEQSLARLVGDANTYYDTQVKIYQIELLQTQNAAERALLEKQIADATAMRDMDTSALFQSGIDKQQFEVMENFRSYFSDSLPSAFSSMGDSFATMISDVLSGNSSLKDSFSNLGKSLQNVLAGIIKDLASATIRMVIFSAISKMIGGVVGGVGAGSSVDVGSIVSTTTSSLGNLSVPSLQFANGSGFKATTLPSNTILSSSTPFQYKKFANGSAFGVAGEAGPEAVMPLDRDSRGRLGVKMTGGAMSNVNVQVIDQRRGDAPPVEIKQSPTQNGGMNIQVLIRGEVLNTLSGGYADSAMKNRYGLWPRQ